MTPACAICRLPLRGRDGFLIMGTEVVHRACAGRGGETVLQEAQRESAAAKALYLREVRRAEAMDRESSVNAALARASDQDRRDRMKAVLDLEAERGRRLLAEQQRDQAQRELAAIRSSPQGESTVSNPESSGLDADMETRFSLLELD